MSDPINCAAEQRKRLTDAWVAVPDEFVQSDDHGDDLAEVIRRMADTIQDYRTREQTRAQSLVEKSARELQRELEMTRQVGEEKRARIAAAWLVIPDEYIPDDDHDHDLAAVIRRMVADLNSRQEAITRLNKIVEEEREAIERLLRRNESRDAASADEYSRGRKELAEELSAAVGEYQPDDGVWHYVIGYLDAIKGPTP